MKQLDSTFLSYAGGLLAETSLGLTGTTMNNIVTQYAIENNVSMTYHPKNMTSKVHQFNGYLNEFNIGD